MDTAYTSLSSLVVDDDDFQTKVNFFFKELQDLGVDDEGLQNIGKQLIVLSSEHVTAKISLLMDKDEFEKWKEFVKTGPNTAQQALVMNKFLEKKIGKDMDTVHGEVTGELMNNILESIRENRELSVQISKLNDEQIKEALELLEKKDFEKLNSLLDIN